MSCNSSDQPLRGRCLSMCPPTEMRLRQRERLVHVLECRPSQLLKHSSAKNKKNGEKFKSQKSVPLQGDPQHFVKEFARSSAGREIQAMDVRPVPVLVRTLRYLLTHVYSRVDCSESSIHEFLCDRLRAVRQDLAVQDLLSNALASPLLAACVRYYTLQHYRMSELPIVDFDPFLNMKQLQEVLAGLVRLYEQLPPPTPKKLQFTFDFDEDDHFLVTKDSGLGSDGEHGTSEHVELSPDYLSTSDEDTAGPNCESNGSVAGPRQATRCRFGGENDELARVLERISGLDLTESTEQPDTSNAFREQSSEKDKKNRLNNAAGEHSKEHRNNTSYSQETTDGNPHFTFSNHTDNVYSSNNGESKANTRSGDLCEQKITELLCEREEMECLYLLLNFDNSEAVQHALELPNYVRSGSLLNKVLDGILKYHSCGSYVSVIRLLAMLPPVLCCALYLSLPKLHKKALQVLSTGHSSANTRYDLSELSESLALQDVDATRRLCRHYGLSVVDGDHVAFNKKDFKADAPVRPLEKARWLDAILTSLSPQQLLLPHPLPHH